MIDVHVHFRDWNQREKETIGHGMAVGALCGIEAFFDMPNTDPPLTTPELIAQRIDYGVKQASGIARVTGKQPFYGVYGGLTSDADQIKRLVDFYHKHHPLIVGFKLFAGHSTGNMGLIGFEQQLTVYETLAECGYRGVLAVHCEKESLLHPESYDSMRPWTHTEARPPEAEVTSIADQIELVHLSGFAGHLHICHISTAESVALVRQARSAHIDISCGATAHHALLDKTCGGQSWNLVKMNPPLRIASDRDAIFNGLLDGSIDWIESDHAPHTLLEKREGAGGIPGFAGYLLLIRALRHHKVRETRLRQLCFARATEVFGLPGEYTFIPDDHDISKNLQVVKDSYGWDPFACYGLLAP